ncbi:hypothetical protein D9M68_151380 [compost metagenome]
MNRPSHYIRNGAFAGIGLYSIIVLVFLGLSLVQTPVPSGVPSPLSGLAKPLPALLANAGPGSAAR